MNSGDRFVLSDDYRDCSVEAKIAKDMSGQSQSVPMTAQVGNVSEFGKYMSFDLRDSFD